ncbi:MAG: hypothetical protein LRY73_04990 [Bacillus sp. (in: Bacteria)]|nr:hypothetical protein [Bacillus sp. (in: firmicutes)]
MAVVSIINYILVLLTPSITTLDWEPYNISTITYSLLIPLMIFMYLLIRKKQGENQQ